MTESSKVAMSLTLAEGVLLGYALVDTVARSLSVRALAIKGPISEAHDLREQRQSVDIDYLVDPDGTGVLRAALEELGWIYRVNTSVGVIAQHSFTMHHPTWPCELDLHHHFPGFLADPRVVFEHLWSDREEVQVAGTAVIAAGRSSMIAVAGLHILRDKDARPRALEDLVTRLDSNLRAEERESLADLAAATGSSESLSPVLRSLGIVPKPSGADPDDLRTWHMRSHVSNEPSIGWVHGFMTSPVRAWPRLMWRGLTLTEAEIRDAYPDLGRGPLAVWRGRARRWRRGFPHIWRAFRALRAARRLAEADASRDLPRAELGKQS